VADAQSRPEERLVGVMYAADPVDADIVVSNAAHWAFRGTGLKNGDALRGLLGYEVDAIYGSGPPGLERLAHSPFVDQGRTRFAAGRLQRAGVASAPRRRTRAADHTQCPDADADRGDDADAAATSERRDVERHRDRRDNRCGAVRAARLDYDAP
jgi:N,N-dimethylformamidase beta subunit-like protein